MSGHCYIGIKNTDGSVDLVDCHDDSFPSVKMPMLAEYYGDGAKVHKLVSKGEFNSLYGNLEDIKFYCGKKIRIHSYKDIHVLHHLFTRGAFCDISYVYIWCDGTWTCVSVHEKQSFSPLDCFAKNGELCDHRGKKYEFGTDFSKLPRVKFDPWAAEYFAETPKAKPVVSIVRLSKEDWLRQHYPDLKELPKWRFPAMVAA
jgi:hypothetical protein